MTEVANLEDLTAALDTPWTPQVVAVEVPEWNATLHVIEINNVERGRFESQFRGGDGLAAVRQRLLAICLCDKHGKRLNPTDEQIKKLATRSARVVNRIYEAAAKLAGITPEDTKELAGESDAG